MPKKKNRRKASARPSRADTSLPALTLGPARTYLGHQEDEELVAMLGAWPFRTVLADGTGASTTLVETARTAGTSVADAAQSIVDLEDAGFLLWQPGANDYWMLTPTQDQVDPLDPNIPCPCRHYEADPRDQRPDEQRLAPALCTCQHGDRWHDEHGCMWPSWGPANAVRGS